MKRLRVAINAQLKPDGPSGGVVTVLRALTALAELDGVEEYVFIGPYEDFEWMRPSLPPGLRIVRGPKFLSAAGWQVDPLEPLKQRLGRVRPVVRGVKHLLAPRAPVSVRAGSSDSDVVHQQSQPETSRAFFQSLGCDVIHFPFQSFEACGIPSVYNPHDLQHLHLGQFFTATETLRREKLYPAACRAAHTVVVASQFVKRDVVERYGIESRKVQVIPWAPPPLPNLSEGHQVSIIRNLQGKYELAGRPFALYPAMTWEHKNHLRLLDAVAHLRDNEGLELRVICTGFKTDFWPNVERRLHELDLKELVTFPGLLPLEELNALYRTAQFVFIPTLFEAASAPMLEAWQHGAPVACSRVTSLPEQAGDGALLFDPFSVREIASTLARMSSDSTLREDLSRRGTRRLEDFSLERTAKAYRAIYRRAAGRKLNEEDRWILGQGGMRGSKNEIKVQRA